MQRIDDDARQPRRIEHAFFEVELPGAVLLRHQPALQPVGEPRDHALQMRKLLVEIAAQPVQFFGLAQILGRDHLVELGDERHGSPDRAARSGHGGADGGARPESRNRPSRRRRPSRPTSASAASAVDSDMSSPVASASSMRRLHVLGLGALAVFAVFLLAALLLALLALVFVGFGRAVVAHVEAVEQIVHHVAEIAPAAPMSRSSRSSSRPARSSISGRHRSTSFLRGRRRRLTGQALAHHHGDRLLDRRIGAVGDFVELAAMKAVVEHGGEILRHARHAARADRLDARLFDRLEHRRAPAVRPASACDARRDRDRRA